MSKVIKIPNPDHPITIRPASARIVVIADGRILADSCSALVLNEASYTPVYYIPRNDANMEQLERSDHSTYCPYKGDCSYFSVVSVKGDLGLNAVWTYESTYPAVMEIREHLAFRSDNLIIIGIYPFAKAANPLSNNSILTAAHGNESKTTTLLERYRAHDVSVARA